MKKRGVYICKKIKTYVNKQSKKKKIKKRKIIKYHCTRISAN